MRSNFPIKHFAILLSGAILLSNSHGAAPDKSGVKPSVISLPKGAGSIEGLGESFEPQLNTGGSTYGVAIALPSGRAGLTPSLRLSYDSNAGNGICGIGWSLDFMSIKRQTDKGFPEYNNGDTFIFQGEELVALNNAGGDWRCENERSFQRLRKIDSDTDGNLDAWEITERNGTRHTLGRFRGQSNRWSVVEHPEKLSQGIFDRTYSWMVDTTTDLHGNRIEYEYTLGYGLLYPSRITYAHLGNASHEVLFQYETRLDAFDDYHPTFSARLDRRLTRIEVRSQDRLVRAYNFSYQYEAGDLRPETAALQSTFLDLGVTLLKRVVQLDRSGNANNFLPPLIFNYAGLDLTKAQLRSFVASPQLDLAEPNGRVQLADLDGDALPDLFSTEAEGAGIVQRVCLNRGETNATGGRKLVFSPSRLVLGFSPVDIGQSNSVVHDPKGKGLVDLSSLTEDGGNKRLETFGNRARLDSVNEERLGFSQEFFETTILPNPPNFVSYGDARTRQMDANFDKRGDFVNLEPSFGSMKVNTYYIRRGGTWTNSETLLPSSYPLANTFATENGQPNPCVHLADMNGDRMLDLLCLTPQQSGTGQKISVSYWPMRGLGLFADERTMSPIPPDTFDIGNNDLRDVLIEDFTGDGLADVIVLDGSGPETVLTLRVNIAGTRWSAPYVRSNLPAYKPRSPSNPTILRLADLNANGSLDLLFRNTAPQDSWTYVEILPGGKPSLLAGVDNSLGKFTSIVYGYAAEDEILAREAGHPWRTFAPIALQVVRRIRTSCGLDLNGDGIEDSAVAEFRYRDPFYDGFEREFRGFAFAQRVDYGDDFLFDNVTGLMQASSGWNNSRTPTGQVSGPSLVTRYRFHTGSGDQRDNDDYGGTLPPFRLIDEFTEVGGREEEPLKGLQWAEEKIDPVVLHSAPDGGFDAGAASAAKAVTPEGQARLTPDSYVYTRSWQDWTVRRLYRPTEAFPYYADQDANGILEDYRSSPVTPTPEGRFASQGISVVNGNGRSVSFAYASNVVTEVREANGLLSAALGYSSQPFLRTLKSADYDNYGNQTVSRDFGVDDPAYDDERFVSTTYAHGSNALSLWIISNPDMITVTDEHGALVSKKVHFYDGAPFVGVQGQIENRALLHRVLENIDSTRTIQASRSKFDQFGNIEETRDPLGNVRRITWDPVFQMFPITETILIGGGSSNLVISAAYDYGFGVVTNSEDFNRNLTAYHYDSFARLVKIVRPGDSFVLPTAAFEYQPADPIRGRGFVYDDKGDLTVTAVPLGLSSRVTTRQREIGGESGEFISASFTDGCGKALATVEEGEVAGTWIVKKATSYNLRLKPKAEWLPFQISSAGIPQFAAIWPAGRPPATDGINPVIVSSDIFYDPLGRDIRTVAAPETWGGPRRESATQYLPFQKRLFDEEDLRAGSPYFGTPHIQFTDGLNRLIAVEEVVKITDAGLSGPVTNWHTSYTYDLNDQLIRIRDSQGNIKTMAFDALKRMTNMNDPDRGQMTFVYDEASNLRETVDAKSQRIVYTYDGANRIKSEDYQDGGPRVFDVEYFYDSPRLGLDLGDGTTGSGNNTQGQIAWVRDLSGETHFSYDSRARIEWEVKRIPDRVHGQLVSFRTRYAYDSADRLQVLTYPDADQVRHAYNPRNLLTRIHGSSLGDVIGSISYRPSGQLFNTRYGNGVNTAYAYDPRLRLTSLETTNSQNTRLIDFAYTFDAASNIEKIEDQRNLNGLPDAAKRFNTQVFSYDSLYRLIRAEYPVLGTPSSNHVAYRYDRIGNMLAQTSDITQQENGLPVANLGTMDSGGAPGRFNRNGRNANDPPGPHALSSIQNSSFATRHYTYDANGNMKSIDGLQCEWDFKDRLIAVENPQMRALYVYDYSDRRITKTIHWKNPGPEKGSQFSSLNSAWRSTATHYINRYYEIREHDAMIKYVWNGPTRVARVTANFGAATMSQNLRLLEGWNLLCLRVGGQFPVLSPGNNPDIGACTWISGGAKDNGLTQVDAETQLPAGATVWIFARQNATVIIRGTPPNQMLVELTGNSQFVGNVLTEPLNVSVDFPRNAWLKQYDTQGGRWRFRFPGGHVLEPLNNASAVVLPGESVWTFGGTSNPSGTNFVVLQMRFYHQDHLGSTAVLTDWNGTVTEEISSYAFGAQRNRQTREGTLDAFTFTQKERDAESGLQYFESRYLDNALARFCNYDRILLSPSAAMLVTPSKLNGYSYVENNPLARIDPTGHYSIDSYNKDAASTHETIDELGASLVQQGLGGQVLAFGLAMFQANFVPKNAMDAAVKTAKIAAMPLSLVSQGIISVSGSVISDVDTQMGEVAQGTRQELNYSRTTAAGFIALGSHAVAVKSNQMQNRADFFTQRLDSGVSGNASGYIYKTLQEREALGTAIVKGAADILEVHGDAIGNEITKEVESLTRSDSNQKDSP